MRRSLRIILTLALRHVRIFMRTPAFLIVLVAPGIVLYTVFTYVFQGPAGRPFKLAVVDQDDSAASHALIDALIENNVKVIRTEDERADGLPLTEETARFGIRRKGKFRVAAVIPRGYGEAPNTLSGEKHAGLDLYYDRTQQTEADIAVGMIQMAAGRLWFEQTRRALASAAGRGAETDVDLTTAKTKNAAADDQNDARSDHLLVRVHQHDVAIDRMVIGAEHTFLAGLVPLFLLFTAVSAARRLLEEISDGHTRRLLVAPIGAVHILGGHLVYSFAVAVTQAAVLYLYAWAVFGVDIWIIAPGLIILTVVTCSATTAFGLLLGALCRDSNHLDSIGTVVVLAMSAVGGSMVPRWIMSDYMLTLGLFTINGWSYDGFISLIRNEGLGGIAESCLVLAGVAAGCGVMATFILARRLVQRHN